MMDGEKKKSSSSSPVYCYYYYCRMLSRMNVNAILMMLLLFCAVVMILFCAVTTYTSLPVEESNIGGVPSSRYELPRVTAPSAGGLRGKMVQMAGRADYWKQRDAAVARARARHEESPKSRSRTTTKDSLLLTAKEVPRALFSFTPPPPLSTAKPYYELEEYYYIDVDGKAFFPRVMSFGWTLRLQEEHHTHVVQVFPAEFTDNTQYYGLADSDDERLSQMEMREPYANEECVPMQDWQVTYHPSCNTMHETALESMGLHAEDDAHLFGTKGYWRNAWRLDLLGGHHHLEDREKIVLKTLK
jgi:hypothetical protein